MEKARLLSNLADIRRQPFDLSIDWSAYRFRASALHRLCSGPSDILSEGNKKYLDQLYYYGEPYFSSPPLEKGIVCEDIAFKLYLPKAKKYPHELSNQFIKGTPDVVLKTKVIDIKCPFTTTSFEAYDNTKARHYYWQLQAYMILAGLRKADILASWVDTPTDIIESNKLDISVHASTKHKTKRFSFKYSQEAKKTIYYKVELARAYQLAKI